MKSPAFNAALNAERQAQALEPAREEALCRMITERTGIVLYDHQMQSLRETVAEACERFGYGSAEDYQRALQEKTSLSPELEFLVGRITVAESYFFRDAAQMALLRERLLPELLARKRLAGDYSLRVWSAGCSSGQEIYSVAILLHELLPDIGDWTLHLLATDINTDVLAAAISGRYRQWSFRATPEPIVNKYFARSGDEHELDERIRKRVRFAYLNLAEDAFPSLLTETYAMDLVLCRNVFIYLDPGAAQRIMHRFAECVIADGVLLLGASDHVDSPTAALECVQAGETSYLRRLSSAPAVAPSVSPNLPARAVADPQGLERVVKLLRAERWRDALIASEQAINELGASAGLMQTKAKALANLGNLAAALQACEQSLALDPTDKHTYLIQGIVLMEHEKPREAEAALRKAVYLDYAFAEAHHQLGLLQLRLGRRDEGRRSLANALALAERGDPNREIHNAPEMNYARFAEILRNEISIYAGATPERRGRKAAARKHSARLH